MCRGHATPAAACHGQRRFRGWMSGRWAGRCARGAYGAALEDRPRCVAEHACASACQHGLVRGWPQHRRVDWRPSERRLDQGRPGQNAKRHRLGRAQPRCRLLALDAVVGGGRLWGTSGRGCKIRGQRGAGARSEDQVCGEPRSQPGLQPVASMRPRKHRHSGRSPGATGRRPIAAPVRSSKA
jgi:hypothetical protein